VRKRTIFFLGRKKTSRPQISGLGGEDRTSGGGGSLPNQNGLFVEPLGGGPDYDVAGRDETGVPRPGNPQNKI